VIVVTATFPFDTKVLERTWAAFDRVAHLRPIRSAEEYDRTVAMMNGLLDIVGDKEDHPLAGLLDLVGELVQEYDAGHYAIEASDPADVLNFLMMQRGLKQTDLGEVVPQSNLSAILAGKRKISATLAGKLARFFNVNAGVFISS
jgi:HTH-type transcriptional regulator/antitoxin HigA